MLSAFLLIPLTAIAAHQGAPAASDELAAGVKIMAGDNAVDVEIGHAAPYYADFDGDGQKTGLSKLYSEYRKLRQEPDDETADEAASREKKADELMDKIQAFSNKELQSIRERMTEIRERMGTARASYHGFVWLYLRQPAGSPASGD
jgi:hypothetical protein